jgi:hypothetical protein
MESVTIKDLPVAEELDTEEMAAVHGGQRIFRITNVRANASGISPESASGSLPVQASLGLIGALDDASAQP